MKRGLRIVLGFAVMAALVFAGGFLGDGKALAVNGRETPSVSASGGQHDPVAKDIAEKPKDRADLADISALLNKTSKTASASLNIYANKTLSGTYSRNICIYGGTTTVSGTVIIYGDLVLIGGNLRMTSGSLTVNGMLYIMDDTSVFAASGGTIAVNRISSAAGTSGYLVNCGTLSIGGTAKMTLNNMADGVFVNIGTFKMSSASAKLTVKAKTCIFDGWSTYGLMTAGTLEVYGDFAQYATDSDYTYCPGTSFKTIFIGTTTVEKKVYFATSAYSYLTDFAFSGGFKFTTDSWISIKKNLSSTTNLSINCNQGNVEYQGNLNGGKLTITGRWIYPTYITGITPGGGTLTVNGAFVIGTGSKLVMNNANDKIIVNGEFDAFDNDYTNLSAGRLEVNGDFYSVETADASDSYTPGPDFTTKISGSDRYVSFDDPAASYFTKLELGTGMSFDSFGCISMNKDLAVNENWQNYPNLHYRGNLNGKILTTGDLTIPSNTTLTTGGGTLQVTGNLTVNGGLVMTDAADVVKVGGSFAVSNTNLQSTALTNGKLFIHGSFSQSGAAAGFPANADHMTILNGGEGQAAAFTDPGTASKFAKLVVDNDSFDTSTVTGKYNELIVTGTTLESVAFTPDTGKLSPAFSGTDYGYVLLLPKGTDSVTITPTLPARYGSNSRMSVENGADNITEVLVDNIPYDGSKSVTILVHAYNDLRYVAYNFTVMQLNPDLHSLGALPEGARVEPDFDPAVKDYTVQLPEPAASFTWAPAADHPESAVHIDAADGPASIAVSLGLGESATHTAMVTANDGLAGNTYNVTFTRRNPVAGITASAGTLTPAFSPAVANYTVNVPSDVASVTIAALKADTDPDWSKFEINDTDQDDVTLSPAPGRSDTATIKAWDKDGKTVSTYTVTVNRVQMLSGITLSTGALTPAFSPDTGSYTVYASSAATSVKVTPVKTASCTSMKINNQAVSYITLPLSLGGKATATIVCTNVSGAQTITQTYTVNVYRVAPITGITAKYGTASYALSPAFSAGYTTYTYTVSVPATTPYVVVTPLKSPYCNDMTMDNNPVTSVKLQPAIGGVASTTIRGTGVDGVLRTYTVNVRRAALITGITLYPAYKLAPAFSATVKDYTVDVPYNVSKVRITPVKARSGVKYITFNNIRASYVYVSPKVGGSVKVAIKAYALDGRTYALYSVTVRRAGLLSGITTSQGALTPAFAGSTPAYTVHLPATTSSVAITPVKYSTVKTLTIDGRAASSKTLYPPVGGSASCTIVVTGRDGISKATYTVRAVRHRPLTGITAADPVNAAVKFALSPVFSPTRLTYDVTLPAYQKSVSISALRATGYNFRIDGGALNVPETIEIAPGQTKIAEITAFYGTTGSVGQITYTVAIHRAGLLTGITAVDSNDAARTFALSPAFSSTTENYDVTIPGGTTSVTLTPALVTGCSYAIDGGAADTPAPIAVGPGGSKTATIVVTKPDAANPGNTEQMTYTVTVHRENLMTSISNNYIDMDFDPAVESYTVEVAGDISSVVISAVASPGCTLTFDGEEKNNVTLYPVSGANAMTTVAVTTPAPESLTRTYTVTVKRGAALGNLTADGSQVAGFDPARRSYEVHMAKPVEGELGAPVTIAVEHSANTTVTINGSETDSLALSMSSADSFSTTAEIVVTPGNSLQPVTYTVTVVWDEVTF